MRKNKNPNSVRNSVELRLLLEAEGFQLAETEAQRVVTAARRLHKAAEDECNGLENTLALRHQQEDVDYLRELQRAGKFPAFRVNGDPRGYPVKLQLPSGRYNTWGGREEGYGICD